MLSAKSSNLALLIEPTKITSDAIVSLSIKIDGAGCCLNRLACMTECTCFQSGTEESCVCYALFLKIRNTLAGTPSATEKSKVGAVCCGYNGGHFYVTWHVKGNGSAIAKSLRLALKCLTPSAMYSIYQQLVKQLSHKPDREEFNFAANKVVNSIKSLVHCAIIGNVKITQEVLDAMAKALQSKIPDQTVDGTKKEPKNHTACEYADKMTINISGWHAAVLTDYITMSKLQGIRTAIHGDNVVIGMNKDKFKNEVKKLKDGVKVFVQNKYAAVKGDLGVVLGLRWLQDGIVSGMDVQDMLKKKVNASELERIIVQGLSKV